METSCVLSKRVDWVCIINIEQSYMSGWITNVIPVQYDLFWSAIVLG